MTVLRKSRAVSGIERKKSLKMRFFNCRQLYLMLLLPVIYLIIFDYVPMLNMGKSMGGIKAYYTVFQQLPVCEIDT